MFQPSAYPSTFPVHAQLVERTIKPATKKTSYVEMMLEQGHGRNGLVSRVRPFFFVSHHWDRPFMETLGMLAMHFEPARQAVWRKGKPILQRSKVRLICWSSAGYLLVICWPAFSRAAEHHLHCP